MASDKWVKILKKAVELAIIYGPTVKNWIDENWSSNKKGSKKKSKSKRK